MEILKTLLVEKYNREIDKITGVKMDTKKLEKGNLFFAINKGNNFIKEALDKGASLVISDNPPDNLKENLKVIKVKNTITEMQDIAKEYRSKLKTKIIAVTGSEGKTTTKDLIYSVLKRKYKGIKTLGNYNNQIGMPYMLLQLKEDDEIAVLELGMSNLGEIERLADISQPNLGVITNIGDSHLEYLINRDNVFKAKTELFKYVDSKNRIVYGDDPYLKAIDAIKIGIEKENDYILKVKKEEFGKTVFSLNKEIYELPINGEHNCLNASFAIVIGKYLEVDYNDIYEGLKSAEISKMRFEKIETKDIIFINDAYNASPVSMRVSLETFYKIPIKKNKVVVLADALELGENELEYHKEILNYAAQRFEKIYVFGRIMEKAAQSLNLKKIKIFIDKNDLKKEVFKNKNSMILLKGSRGMKLEEVIGEEKDALFFSK